MAWTSPKTWSVAEVVTAANMNLHIRDNLSYLKSAPTFDGAPIMAGGTMYLKATSQNNNQIRFQNSAGTNKTAIGSDINTNTGVNTFEVFDLVANALRLIVADGGNVGIGVAAPAGRLHAVGAGGGFMFLSANAVTSLQTLAPAGTVAHGATFYISDENNNGGGMNSSSGSSITLSGSFTYVNSDTITVAITAGGAITVQRTTGTSGAHNINMLVLYF